MTIKEAQIHRLNDGIFDPHSVPSLLVPVTVSQLSRPSISWINDRWFQERGFDIQQADTRREVSDWLISSFAFVVADGVQPETLNERQQTFYADRYGGSGLESHGGSGRAAYSGRFQVKGVGPTPLIGRTRAWQYKHGCMWLEEAVREAIFAEVVNAEFPFGAVPIIAVIDTGMNYYHREGIRGERRALAIRPAAIRLAHFERASLFRNNASPALSGAGALDPDGPADAHRVSAMIDHVVGGADDISASCLLERYLVQYASQIAFGRVHRLFIGTYSSSNMTVDGALIDFGSMRAVPDWSRACTTARSHSLGTEMEALVSLARSLAFLFQKYLGQRWMRDRTGEMLRSVLSTLRTRVEAEYLKLFDAAESLPEKQKGIIEACDMFFNYQQKLRVDYARGLRSRQGWLLDGLTRGADKLLLSTVVVDRVRELLSLGPVSRVDREDEDECLSASAMRMILPRPELDRETLQSSIFEITGGREVSHAPDATALERFIARTLTTSRRIFPSLPAGWTIMAQRWHGGSILLECRQPLADERSYWLESVRRGNEVLLLDRWVALRDPISTTGVSRWCGPAADLNIGAEALGTLLSDAFAFRYEELR